MLLLKAKESRTAYVMFNLPNRGRRKEMFNKDSSLMQIGARFKSNNNFSLINNFSILSLLAELGYNEGNCW